MGNPSQSYGASLAIWNHSLLPATRHKWTRPAITPARQAGTRFTYMLGEEGDAVCSITGFLAWFSLREVPERCIDR